jgi:hypothetical protein
MILVATELHVKNFWKFFPFLKYSIRSTNQAKKADGCLHVSVKGKGFNIGYTLTAWKDKESMLHFRNSGPHKIAMKQIRNVSDRYKTVVWESDSIPDWNEAKRRVDEVQYKILS